MRTPALLSVALAAPAFAQEAPQYAIKSAPAKTIQGTATFDVSYPKFQVGEWVVFAAVAPDLPSQTRPRTTMEPTATAATDLSPLARKLLQARVPAATPNLKTGLRISVTYEAALRSRELETLPAGAKPEKVADLSPRDRKLFLLDRENLDWKSDGFQRWLKAKGLARTAGEGDVDLARRAFRAVKDATKYEYTEASDRRASAVCKSGKSDCGGIAAVFVAACRANGVPARCLYGRWATSADPAEKLGGVVYYQWHVKAEFFAAGVGWVPADPAGGVLHDTTAEGLRFFGRDPGDFLTFHLDPGVEVETVHLGKKPVLSLQKAAWWVTGKGTLDGGTVREGWTVKVLK